MLLVVFQWRHSGQVWLQPSFALCSNYWVRCQPNCYWRYSAQPDWLAMCLASYLKGYCWTNQAEWGWLVGTQLVVESLRGCCLQGIVTASLLVGCWRLRLWVRWRTCWGILPRWVRQGCSLSTDCLRRMHYSAAHNNNIVSEYIANRHRSFRDLHGSLIQLVSWQLCMDADYLLYDCWYWEQQQICLRLWDCSRIGAHCPQNRWRQSWWTADPSWCSKRMVDCLTNGCVQGSDSEALPDPVNSSANSGCGALQKNTSETAHQDACSTKQHMRRYIH